MVKDDAFNIIIEALSRYKHDPKKFRFDIRSDGLGVSIHKAVTDEIISELTSRLNITHDNAEEIMKSNLKRILDVLSDKILNNQNPSDEVGRIILDRIYNEELRYKYLLASTAIAPIINDIDIVSINKSTDNENNIKSYLLKIKTLNLNGEYSIISIEASKYDLKLLVEMINSTLGGEEL